MTRNFVLLLRRARLELFRNLCRMGIRRLSLENDLPYDKLITSLKSTIYYIDGQEVIRSEKQKTENVVCQGGTHWNEMEPQSRMTLNNGVLESTL